MPRLPRDAAGRLAAALSAIPAIFAALLLAALAAAVVRAEEPPACEAAENLLSALPPADVAAIEAEAAAVPNGEGRLYRIEGEGTAPSHLFGTMHLSDPRVLTLPRAVEEAFAASDRLVVETLDVADESAVAAAVLARPDLTILPAGSDLLSLVPADRRDDVATALDAHGMPAASVRTLQPWFVTVGLVVPPCEAARQAAGAKVLDLELLERAEAEAKTVSGLESAAEQLEALASMPLEMQAENLVATVDLVDRMPDIFETMVDLYREGRIAMISPAIESLAPSGADGDASAAIYTQFEERVVTARNRTMDERLVPLLEDGGAFVAVGALHLPGEEGLVELLRTRGWRVTRAD